MKRADPPSRSFDLRPITDDLVSVDRMNHKGCQSVGITRQSERLLSVCLKLCEILDRERYPEVQAKFALAGAPDARKLFIGNIALIITDPHTNHFILEVSTLSAGLFIITTNERQLVNYIVQLLRNENTRDVIATDGYVTSLMIGMPLEQVEKCMIVQTLRHCRGNRTRTAQLLGISSTTLRKRLSGYDFSERKI